MTDPHADPDGLAGIRDRLLDAALPHVPFDGWTQATFDAAVTDSDVDPALARAAFPRGAVDMALAFHYRGDALMAQRIAEADLAQMRFRDRVAAAIRFRLEAMEMDKEAVRRGATLFALPNHAADGAGAIWHTADAIWTALGDTARDYNWYTKRATLSAIYSSTVLYWLGDDSPGHQATWEFLDRRIDNVMSFEGVKGKVMKSPLGRVLEKGPLRLLDRVRAPDQTFRENAPGWTRR